MAKNKEVKPLPIAVAVIILVAAVALMAAYAVYLFAPADEVSHTDKVVDQSFTVESEDEPAPVVGEEKEYFDDANVGDYVKFGHYEQNGKTEDGAEPIEWQVLAKEEGRLLVISRYCLDCVPYNSRRSDASWADSSLRTWLSEEFYNKAFTAEEAEIILDTRLDEATTDKLFVLSNEDAEAYFEYATWRSAVPTDLARANGVRVQDGACWWWLRNAGAFENSASYVGFGGEIGKGFAVDYNAVAVRPVMWVAASESDESSSSESSDAFSDSSEAESNTSE